MAKLSDKQCAFIDEFLVDFNATQAAIRAGYSEKTARSIGSENLTKPNIAKEIKARLAEKTMSADEVLTRLTEQARANFGDFVVIDNDYSWRFDMKKVREKGHLVKSISTSKNGVRIELYDAQAALLNLGKLHSLFIEKVEHSGEIHTVNITSDQMAEARRKAREFEQQMEEAPSDSSEDE